MKHLIEFISRALYAFLICVGVTFTSCEGFELPGSDNDETPEKEVPATINLDDVESFSATLTGRLNVDASEVPFTRVSILYSSDKIFHIDTADTLSTSSFDEQQNYSITLTDLECLTEYHYCLYVKVRAEEFYGELQSFTTLKHPYLIESDIDPSSATDLSSSASANCYIVSEAGTYKFKAVKGNSETPVGDVASASILWETFGTDKTPELFDLIRGTCHKDGFIVFKTADSFREGNAVISANDAEGKILWSWHIWLTDQPQEQVYFNDAGTMMDRNLGAIAADPGHVGALGLLYQWGRKDPFLSSSSINEGIEAMSTITWPERVKSESSTGTIEYTIANPTTFIGMSLGANNDWHYTDDQSNDNTRWTTSENAKSIYDPCPVGWRVPDGGENGIWAKAIGFSSKLFIESDKINRGMNFSGIFGPDQTIWYPSGMRNSGSGTLISEFTRGNNWSASTVGYSAYDLSFHTGSNNIAYPSHAGLRDRGQSVRCCKEE